MSWRISLSRSIMAVLLNFGPGTNYYIWRSRRSDDFRNDHQEREWLDQRSRSGHELCFSDTIFRTTLPAAAMVKHICYWLQHQQLAGLVQSDPLRPFRREESILLE